MNRKESVGRVINPGPRPGHANVLSRSDFATQAAAQACYDHCWALTGRDIHQLDRDRDGITCETLPVVAITATFSMGTLSYRCTFDPRRRSAPPGARQHSARSPFCNSLPPAAPPPTRPHPHPRPNRPPSPMLRSWLGHARSVGGSASSPLAAIASATLSITESPYRRPP